MKMRKALSFVLVLALVLGSFGMVFAAPAVQGTALSDIEGNANYDAIVANTDLGIITGYEDGTYKPSNAVNRAEFAAMITRMLNIPESALAGYSASSFTDMGSYSWAKGYVGFCQAKGIITGYGDGTFGPGNTITVNEAVTMVLRAVGYVSTSDELVGNWPSNYVTLAKRLGIYDDVTSTATIDRANAAQVIYNALTCEVVTVNANGDTSQAFAVYAENDTTGVKVLDHYKSVLEAYLDCTPTGKILYTDALADSSVVNTKAYVGAYVKAFLNSDDDVIAIAEVLSTFLTGDYNATKGEFKADGVKYTLSGTVVENMSGGGIVYKLVENGKATTGHALYFNNGTSTTGAIFTSNASITGITLAVDLSGKTIKEVYSANKWESEGAFKFETDMLEKDALNGYDFILDDNDNIDDNSYILEGVTSLDKIAKDNVVEVYLKTKDDIDSGIVKVSVGTEVVEGKVTMIDDGDYTIGGKVYSLATGVTDIDLGDTGKAYLNYDGKIAFWDVTNADSDNYAIVTGTTSALVRDTMLELIDKNGNKKDYVLDVDEFMTSDGAVASGTSLNTSLDGLAVGDIVTFSLDKNGKIDTLNAVSSAGIVSGSSMNGVELSANRTVIGDMLVDSGVVVFVEDGDDYTVTSLANIKTKTDLTEQTKVFKDPTDGKIKVIITTKSLTGADSIYAMINKATVTYNSDDDKVQLVQGFANGKKYSAYTDANDTVADTLIASTAAFAVGKIAELSVDANGIITKATPAATNVSTGATTVYAIDKNGRNLGIATTTSSDFKVTTWAAIDDDAVIYVYDTTADAGEIVSLGTWSSIKTFKANGNNVSEVCLYQFDDDSEYYDFVVIVK
jgi:hypothetical protein